MDVPPLRARVNDLAKILTAEKTQQLEEQLRQFEQQTSHQIAILTIPSLEGDPIEDFSIRVAEAWKIGQKGTANGVILIVAQKERKIRIEVGRGFEGILPDVVASRIIREVIAPRYREGDYAGSIQAGINSILEVTRGETVPKSSPTRTRRTPPGAGLLHAAALFARFVGISQRTPLRGALGGAISGGVIGSPCSFGRQVLDFGLPSLTYGRESLEVWQISTQRERGEDPGPSNAHAAKAGQGTQFITAEAGMVVVEVISAAAGLEATLATGASAAGVGILAVEVHQGMGKA